MGAESWDRRKQLWEVVGGAQKGGILVRAGESTGSQELETRLSHGAFVQQEQLTGQRLHYSLLEGSGPPSGWVSLRLNQQDLLVQRASFPAGLQPARQQGFSPEHAADQVLEQPEVLAAIFGGLRLPWAGAALLPVCRSWRAFLQHSSKVWAELLLAEPRDLPALARLLPRAGARLRVLDLSKVKGRSARALPPLATALRACTGLERLNLNGWEHVSLASAPEVLASLAKSLTHLHIKGCNALHPQLMSMLGPKLQVLEAGWLSENDEERDWGQWSRIFPQGLFRAIGNRCPKLAILRVPGYALYNGQGEREVQRLLREYAEVANVGSLQQLRRLDLSCAQLLEDPAVSKIAAGCRSLRTLGLRSCANVTDRGIQAVAENLGRSLAHINISCCQLSERVVRRLVLRCAGLKTLDLCYCRGLGPGIIAYLCADPALCPQLRMIGAGGLDLKDQEIEAMCKKYSGTLDHLGIGSCLLTDAGLEMLAGLPLLRRLSAHQLRHVSASGLTKLCLTSPSLTDVDADQCTFTPLPTAEEMRALQKCLDERPYDYDAPEEDSDDEELERTKREREEKEKQKRERGPETVLLAMGAEMGGFM